MTIAELLDRIGSAEIAEWAVIFADEDERLRQLTDDPGAEG